MAKLRVSCKDAFGSTWDKSYEGTDKEMSDRALRMREELTKIGSTDIYVRLELEETQVASITLKKQS